MKEIVFFPDSGAGLIMGFGVVMAVLAVGGVAAVLRKGQPPPGAAAWAGFVVLAGLGAAAVIWPSLEARAVAVGEHAVILRYRWPHPDVRLELPEIRDVRVQSRGTQRPSPHLVVEAQDGDIYEGEGTNSPENVYEAKRAIDRLLRGH